LQNLALAIAQLAYLVDRLVLANVAVDWLESFGMATRCKSKGAGARCWSRLHTDSKV
jgi:hypothetical protein